MNPGYHLFTVNAQGAVPGALVEHEDLGGGIRLPAILLGDPLHQSKASLHVSLDDQLHTLWQQTGQLQIPSAKIASSALGTRTLVASTLPAARDACILVIRTELGFHGNNSLTGDWTHDALAEAQEDAPRVATPFPGTKLLSCSVVRRGAHAGTGEQCVALVQAGMIVRVSTSMHPLDCRFFCWDGVQLHTASARERLGGTTVFPTATSV